ncbi:hypothetical protein F0562_025168 [Nyssa sinensis]|uniref:NAC domain-containing protein n=1 Tax=Nyssa sinensis TaxID=561372 RepID=A0A5J5BDK2_9ASTE|nr:hypothetical protein F0562_025168 [Nyssa sinensis]
MEESLPPGFRFHPTDEELITYYLTHKVSDFNFTSKAIADVDFNKCEPWDLPDGKIDDLEFEFSVAKASMGEKEWYFFSLRDRKYPTGLRTNRATEAGYWKTTGKDKEIYSATATILVGMKKTLVFYRGRAPKGEKTNWVMHEYRLKNKLRTKEEWVVCRVFQKSTTVKKPQQTPSSQQSPDSPCDTNTIGNDFGDIEIPNLNRIASSSSGISNVSLQNYNNMNLNLNANWTAAREAASLPSLPAWPSSLLSSNLSVNSLLLRALQLRSYQPREATSTDYSFLSQGISHLGTDFSSNFTASSSKDLDSVQQQLPPPPQPPLPPPQEQPFNLDSIW